MRNLTIMTLITLLGTATVILLLAGAYLVSLPLLMSGSILFITTTTAAGLYINHK